MSNIKALLAEARLPEKTVELCLRGDLVAEYEQVEADHDRAVAERGDSLAGGNIAELRQRMDSLREQMTAGNVTFRLRALPRPEFRKLVAAHPPRQNDDGTVDEKDALLEVNRDTFFDALLRASVVDPELDAEDWELLDGRLTDRQWDQITLAAWNLNRRDVDVPFSLADSKTPT